MRPCRFLLNEILPPAAVREWWGIRFASRYFEELGGKYLEIPIATGDLEMQPPRRTNQHDIVMPLKAIDVEPARIVTGPK